MAFLNGMLNEEVLIEISKGLPHAANRSKIYRVKRALYGLKQALRVWYARIDTWLISQGYTKSQYDTNL